MAAYEAGRDRNVLNFEAQEHVASQPFTAMTTPPLWMREYFTHARVVFREVTRVLRVGGHYFLACANPFVFGLSERDWTGAGYLLTRPYVDGAELTNADPEYVYDRDRHAPIQAPREFRHNLSTLVRGLVACGFVLEDLADNTSIQPDPQAAPGTWNHLVAIAPPWLASWCRLSPDVFKSAG